MRVALVHLSDMHLKADGTASPCVDRATTIANAAASALAGADATFLVISGDLAYSGKSAEYNIVGAFLRQVQAQLASRTATPVPLVVVPGNHDVDFPAKGSEGARDLMIANVTEETIDCSVLDFLTAAQRDFRAIRSEFRGSLACVAFGDQMVEIEHHPVAPTGRVVFQLLNSAWMSKIHEEQGALLFPISRLGKVPRCHLEGALVVAVLHHPYNWFAAENARRLHAHLEQTSDVILTGHEHDPASFTKVSRSGTTSEYVEGGMLFEEKQPGHSSFNVVVADVEKEKVNVLTFALVDGVYRTEDRDNWKDFKRNTFRARAPFVHNETFRKRLRDVGANFTHRSGRNPVLADLFVYPELRELRIEGRPRTTERFAASVVDFIQQYKRVLITGTEGSGKSTLSRKLTVDLHELGIVPVLVGPRDVKARDYDALERSIRDVLREQYGGQTADPFLQLPLAQRAVIFDDWDQATLSHKAKNCLLQSLHRIFGTVVLLASHANLIDDFAATERPDGFLGILEYSHAQIMDLGYVKRSDLVRRWQAIGDPVLDQDETSALRRAREAEALLSMLVTRGMVPSQPLYLLILLQEFDAKRNPAAASGSYGYLYEALITASLLESTKEVAQIDAKYNYLAELAYFLFDRGEMEAALGDLRLWHERYTREFLWPMDFESTLQDLIRVRILEDVGGMVRFRYGYLRCYFVARRLHHKLETDSARDTVARLVSSLHDEESANILMFVAYLSRSPFVFETMLRATRDLLKEVPEADLVADPKFLGAQPGVISPLSLDAGADPERNRRRELEQRDEADRRNGDDDTTVVAGAPTQRVIEVETALRTIQILGQVLRNFPGSIQGERKIEIAEAACSLGLRLIKALLVEVDVLKEAIRVTFELLFKKLHPESSSDRFQLAQNCNAMLFGMCEAMTFGLVKHISSSVGTQDLEPVYAELGRRRRSVSFSLLDLSIKLDHFTNFPKRDALALHRELEREVFARALIHHLVWYRFYMYRERDPLRQEVCQKLGIQLAPVRAGAERKQLPGP